MLNVPEKSAILNFLRFQVLLFSKIVQRGSFTVYLRMHGMYNQHKKLHQ
jgi:hypothetical protein